MNGKRVGLALALSLAVTQAQAAFHFMSVVEVFPGTAAAPTAQYVVLQMYSGGQNLVNTHSIQVFDAAGVQIMPSFTFSGNVANGANQSKILIATAAAQTFFNVTPDLLMGSATIPLAGGKVCFDGIDCVAWGNYSGPAGSGGTAVGTPLNRPDQPGTQGLGGLLSGKAAIRRLNVAGSPTVLEAADDTNNSASDFVFGLPAPRNNSGINGAIPPNTCLNGVVEGLEECDDGDGNNTNACTNDCLINLTLFGDGFE